MSRVRSSLRDANELVMVPLTWRDPGVCLSEELKGGLNDL